MWRAVIDSCPRVSVRGVVAGDLYHHAAIAPYRDRMAEETVPADRGALRLADDPGKLVAVLQ